MNKFLNLSKRKYIKIFLIFIQVFILFVSTQTFSVFATEIEEPATNPDKGWITLQAYVDPNANTNIVSVAIVNNDTYKPAGSYTLHKINNYKDIITLETGNYTISSCRIENDLLGNFPYETKTFKVENEKNTLVTFNIGDPNAELITEEATTKDILTTENTTSSNSVHAEEATKSPIVEEPTTAFSDIQIIEQIAKLENRDTIIKILSIVAAISLVFLLAVIVFLFKNFKKRKRNR